MKRSVQEKFVVLYDTAKKCLLILDHLFTDLENGTNVARDAEKIKNDSSIVIMLYITALGIIDYFHRFHEVISAMTLIRKDQPELKKLTKVMAPVKECRNYLQHMRGDLMKNESIDYPILGALSWIYEGRNYVLYSNQATRSFSMPGIAFDRLAGNFVCKYQLVVGGHEIKLDVVYREAKSFWAWIETSVVIEPAHVKHYAWGNPGIMYSEFRQT